MQEVWKPSRQNTQVLSWKAKGAMTKSPGFTVRTSAPISSTTAISSWPIGVPCDEAGMEWYGCRSDPQTHARTMRTIASVGCWMSGSGTFSTRTSPAPNMKVASMRPPGWLATHSSLDVLPGTGTAEAGTDRATLVKARSGCGLPLAELGDAEEEKGKGEGGEHQAALLREPGCVRLCARGPGPARRA